MIREAIINRRTMMWSCIDRNHWTYFECPCDEFVNAFAIMRATQEQAMQTNLDATDKAEVLADAIRVFRASRRGMLSCMEFERRLQSAGFDYRFINDTLCEIR